MSHFKCGVIVKILPPKNIILYMGLTLLNYMFLKWIGIYDDHDVPMRAKQP